MKTVKRGACILLILLSIALTCSACGTFEKAPLDPLNYTTYRNKEIATVLNLVETHMANASVLNAASMDVEKTQVDNDIRVTQDSIASVKNLIPPKGYEQDRRAVLTAMENCCDSLIAYQKYLTAGNEEYLGDCIQSMSIGFTNLKSLFNNEQFMGD